MNSKYIKFFLIFSIFFLSGTAFAQYEKINIEVLPSTWYSSVNILEKQEIKIFAGIQNHSSSGYSFKGSFYIDDKEIYSIEGNSKPDSLLEIFAPWKATTFGNHSIQFKIISTSINSDNFISKESDKNNIFVAKNLSVDALTDKAKDIVKDEADSIVKKIDDSISNFTDKISDKILSYKSDSPEGQVLGASTTYSAPSMIKKITNNKTVSTVWDMILNFFSYIIKNWKISVVIIIILGLLIKFIV